MYNKQPEMQGKIQESIELSRIKACREEYLLNCRFQKKLQLLETKAIIAEREREIKKAQCDVIVVDENGNLVMQTKNLRIENYARKIVNFTFPEIVLLQRLKNGENKIFLFVCDINGEVCHTLLEFSKCTSPTYLLRKFASIGAEIFAPTLAIKKQYITQIITELISKIEKKMLLPDRRGWYTDENGVIQFFQGRWTWEEAIECTK